MKTSKKEKTETAAIAIITHDILRSWKPCQDGYKRFCQLFPDGSDLRTASDGLTKDGFPEWGNWLWEKCAKLDAFRGQTVVTAPDNGTATAGDAGTATAGYAGTATAGTRGLSLVL